MRGWWRRAVVVDHSLIGVVGFILRGTWTRVKLVSPDFSDSIRGDSFCHWNWKINLSAPLMKIIINLSTSVLPNSGLDFYLIQGWNYISKTVSGIWGAKDCIDSIFYLILDYPNFLERSFFKNEEEKSRKEKSVELLNFSKHFQICPLTFATAGF